MENLDWGNLGFGYRKTDYNVRSYFRGGKWEELTLSTDENISMSMAASCLHYGQECFEGLKAFRGKDGRIRLFRVDENAKRMISSAEYLCMAAPSVEMFTEAVKKVVLANERFVPPLRHGRLALHPAAADRHGSADRRASGRRIPVHRLRHARGPLL